MMDERNERTTVSEMIDLNAVRSRVYVADIRSRFTKTMRF